MKTGGWISELRAHQAGRGEWRQWLCSALPEELGAAVVDAHVKGEVLIVQAVSAAWASRLRFALPAIAAAVHERAPGVVTVKVKVAPVAVRRAGAGVDGS